MLNKEAKAPGCRQSAINDANSTPLIAIPTVAIGKVVTAVLFAQKITAMIASSDAEKTRRAFLNTTAFKRMSRIASAR